MLRWEYHDNIVINTDKLVPLNDMRAMMATTGSYTIYESEGSYSTNEAPEEPEVLIMVREEESVDNNAVTYLALIMFLGDDFYEINLDTNDYRLHNEHYNVKLHGFTTEHANALRADLSRSHEIAIMFVESVNRFERQIYLAFNPNVANHGRFVRSNEPYQYDSNNFNRCIGTADNPIITFVADVNTEFEFGNYRVVHFAQMNEFYVYHKLSSGSSDSSSNSIANENIDSYTFSCNNALQNDRTVTDNRQIMDIVSNKLPRFAGMRFGY